MSKEQLQTNNNNLGGNNTELNDILQTINDNLIDLTGDTVTAETLAKGVTAHDANGNAVTGTMPSTIVSYEGQELSKMVFSINENGGLRITITTED